RSEGRSQGRGRAHPRRRQGRHRPADRAGEGDAARTSRLARRRRRGEDPAPRSQPRDARRAAQPAEAGNLTVAEAATIARPYAEAVFGLAQKQGAFAPWLGVLATMARSEERRVGREVAARCRAETVQAYVTVAQS